ncbi:MAG: hypothetical protein WDZ40_01055 [Candidatus Spechtbacterales bacterium]
MPPLRKLLSKFNKEERIILEKLIEKIISLDWRDLDVKKLKGHNSLFRVRKGQFRIIFIKTNDNISILAIERRNDNTYKNI